uniref:hypothetical protein n=1 Tax=Picosynechococcus sp. PCC 11901 TaxID=2579791 RepID=UPI00143D2D24
PAGITTVSIPPRASGSLLPDQGPGFNADKHRAELQRLRVEHQAKEAQRLASLPTIPKRHQKILGYKAQLTPTQNADLLQRGLTQAEIDFALSKHCSLPVRVVMASQR